MVMEFPGGVGGHLEMYLTRIYLSYTPAFFLPCSFDFGAKMVFHSPGYRTSILVRQSKRRALVPTVCVLPIVVPMVT